ncbi:MAG: DUF3892 domain-containing protein [Methanobacteriaceae archaeon]|jgi:hypothetical protein|nr:MAG: hypothetical protein CIT01_03355 [Methanobacterium sp. BRmetb2]MCC7558322.1 DUF3892 domain-containing protein [Methanobacteriaceae archaeon]
MVKWADYCIFAVRYNSERTHIERLRGAKDLGDKLGDAKLWSREQVVAGLEKGYEFVTVIKNNTGRYDKGQKVELIEVDGTKYMRTDKNSIASDNLENLEEF